VLRLGGCLFVAEKTHKKEVEMREEERRECQVIN